MKSKEYMQEAQHTQQTATRIAQNQDIETAIMLIGITKNTHRRLIETRTNI